MPQAHKENVLGTILGWGALGVFALVFGWTVGAPLIIGERWADQQDNAIAVLKNQKPEGSTASMDDLIRDYSIQMKGKEVYVGEFNWSAMQQEGPEYQVTLLWREGNERKAALWRVNLQTGEIRPQGDEASNLVKRIQAPNQNPG